MTTLFISDLHLDQSRPVITEAFFRFMDQKASSAESLYILGDFFEVWIGDDDPAPFNQGIIAKLRAFTDTGKKLFVMVGNRDFLMSDGFALQTGATMLADPTLIDLNGTATLLMHGDSLCTQDIEYMAFRQQARSEAWQQQMLSQPVEVRRALAAQLRAQSKSMNSLKAEDIMDVTGAEVVKDMLANGATRMIHGHTHRPARHPVDLDGSQGERIVLGDWREHLWWLESSENSLQLEQRPIDSEAIA